MENQYLQLLLEAATILGGIAVLIQFLSYSRRIFTGKKSKRRKTLVLFYWVLLLVFLFDFLYVYINRLPISHIVIRPLFELGILKPLPDMVNIKKQRLGKEMKE